MKEIIYLKSKPSIWFKLCWEIKKFWVTRILRRPWVTGWRWLDGYGKMNSTGTLTVELYKDDNGKPGEKL